jgi:hypothetical protein
MLTAIHVEAAPMNEACPVVVDMAPIPPPTTPRLLDQVRGILRAKHYSYRTEQV